MLSPFLHLPKPMNSGRNYYYPPVPIVGSILNGTKIKADDYENKIIDG